MLEIGSIIDGKYKILNKIGQGGMSVVYLAMNERANKQWAIKEVRKDGTKDYEVVKQGLIAETDILKRLNHPHLPSIIDVIDCDDTFLIVMDYIEGRTLDHWLKKEGAQPQERVVEWAKQICDVLGYLHSRKPPIIYRDLKPSNVMLKPDGKIMIIDFGTAREFKEQSIEDTKCLGTQGYAAPEQYGGHGQTDARTDIYNLGATMYHLLTGHNPSLPPYEMYPIRQWNPALSSGLEAIVTKCTQRNPNDRYQSCAELMYALEHFDELDIEYRKQQKRKWGTFLAACSLTAVSLIGCLGFKFAENSTIKNSYDGYLRAASNAATQAEKVDYYRDAINLDPSRGDAWLSLLDVFIDGTGTGDGGLFTQEEDVQMKEILGYTGSGNRTNESYLESNQEAYDEFSFQMGLAYFYYYGEEGNKPMSQSWFETAAESDSLEPNKVERAKRFAKIAGYSQGLDTRDLAGDSEVSYADYWADMVELTSGDLTSIDNEQTALVMYREMVYQIYKNALNFRQAGVTERDMMDELQNIRSTLMSGFATDEVSGTKNEILESIEEAETQVNAAFSSQAGQTGGETDAGN
ncbi:MAG TPA: serine/threonine protein kinase [Candidatus Mediterraneibacter faecipullorum]|uniref:Serine/threonine protein kinase n=1 Tax=Candidatus Mediterraneibacter faecipullorum TaxID=2838670 RepID=A0A9D2SSV3_9FIRM|nr:serine/threonine protein kinase [Candidatus Mediterraneibacter faecipullorum]